MGENGPCWKGAKGGTECSKHIKSSYSGQALVGGDEEIRRN